MSITKSTGTVWDHPVERELLKIMSLLSGEVINSIEIHKQTQQKASEKLGVPHSWISNAVTGKIDRFTIAMLVSMLKRVVVSPLRKVG